MSEEAELKELSLKSLSMDEIFEATAAEFDAPDEYDSDSQSDVRRELLSAAELSSDSDPNVDGTEEEEGELKEEENIWIAAGKASVKVSTDQQEESDDDSEAVEESTELLTTEYTNDLQPELSPEEMYNKAAEIVLKGFATSDDIERPTAEGPSVDLSVSEPSVHGETSTKLEQKKTVTFDMVHETLCAVCSKVATGEQCCELAAIAALTGDSAMKSNITEISYVKPLVGFLSNGKGIDEKCAVLDIIGLLFSQESTKVSLVQNGIVGALRSIFEESLHPHKDVVGIDAYRKYRSLLKMTLEVLLQLLSDSFVAQQALLDAACPLLPLICGLLDLRRGRMSAGYELFGDNEVPAMFGSGSFDAKVEPITVKPEIAFWVSQALGEDSDAFLWSKVPVCNVVLTLSGTETNWADKMTGRGSACRYPSKLTTLLLEDGVADTLKIKVVEEKVPLRTALTSNKVTECQLLLVSTVSPTVYWMLEVKRWRNIMNHVVEHMPLSEMQQTAAKFKLIRISDWVLVEVDAESVFPTNIRQLLKEFNLPVYRAVVLSRVDSGTLRVFALDYGFTEIVRENATRVFQCPPGLTNFSSALVLCVLPDLAPSPDIDLLRPALQILQCLSSRRNFPWTEKVAKTRFTKSLLRIVMTNNPEMSQLALQVLINISRLGPMKRALVEEGVVDVMLYVAAGIHLSEDTDEASMGLLMNVCKVLSNVCFHCQFAKEIFKERRGLALLTALVELVKEDNPNRVVVDSLLFAFFEQLADQSYDQIGKRVGPHCAIRTVAGGNDPNSRTLAKAGLSQKGRSIQVEVPVTEEMMEVHRITSEENQGKIGFVPKLNSMAHKILSSIALVPQTDRSYRMGQMLEKRAMQNGVEVIHEFWAVEDLKRLNKYQLEKFFCGVLNSRLLAVVYFGVSVNGLVSGRRVTMAERDELRLGVDTIFTRGLRPAVDPGAWTVEFIPVICPPNVPPCCVVEVALKHVSHQVFSMADGHIFVREADQTVQCSVNSMREHFAKEFEKERKRKFNEVQEELRLLQNALKT